MSVKPLIHQSINQNFFDQKLILTSFKMSSQDLKVINEFKKNKVLKNLKCKPFCEQKSSNKLLTIIQNQRDSIVNDSDNDKSTQMYDLLLKQRKVVLQLDEENVSLVKQNTSLKTILNIATSKLESANKVNIELREQNESLKQQLLISQVNCAKMVNRLKRK